MKLEYNISIFTILGECSCVKTEVDVAYVAQGGKALINWKEPKLKCPTGVDPTEISKDVSPDLSPPAEFKHGLHTVTYTIRYKRSPGEDFQTRKCPVEIAVEGEWKHLK